MFSTFPFNGPVKIAHGTTWAKLSDTGNIIVSERQQEESQLWQVIPVGDGFCIRNLSSGCSAFANDDQVVKEIGAVTVWSIKQTPSGSWKIMSFIEDLAWTLSENKIVLRPRSKTRAQLFDFQTTIN